MESVYGKYPKKIICQCNAGEMDSKADTIELNDRCPICHSVRRICIPKAEVRKKANSRKPVARKVKEPVLTIQKGPLLTTQKEPVLTTQKELEPLVIWGQILHDQVDRSFSYYSYFMTLPERMFWIYTSAFLTPYPEMLQRKSQSAHTADKR